MDDALGLTKMASWELRDTRSGPELFDYLDANGFGYAIRLKANKVLERRIGYLLKRRRGRPSGQLERHYANFTYQAKSWSKPRQTNTGLNKGTAHTNLTPGTNPIWGKPVEHSGKFGVN